jgi:succinate-semialdehyde dehydrogenase/glutarate-semialdehyde dehydrogenase
MLRADVDKLALHITLDQGKPLAEARLEVLSCAEHAEWHGEECRRIYGRVIPARGKSVRQTVTRHPLGVCVAFTPWNFPMSQAIRKICAALGAGCTIVLKGPEDSPSAVNALARIFLEAGLPPGCLNTVWGEPTEISEFLISAPEVRKVSFTGSVLVGKHLASLAGRHMKRMTMELGGHSPVIVFADADIGKAARALALQKVRNAGQVCVSPTRLYIEDAAYTEFRDSFTRAYTDTAVGDGLIPGTKMGPLAHQRRVTAMDALVKDAQTLGCEVTVGLRPSDLGGSFYPPTVLTDVDERAQIMREEPFGPVVPLLQFSGVDEVISRANSLPFGLASYLFTSSLSRSAEVSERLEAGMVSINHFGIGLPETPFGGIKDSGFGSEGGQESFDAYLYTKFISENYAV